MGDDDLGYEIGQDDLSRKRSKQYHQNDDESLEGKLLQGILNNLDCKLNLLKARCTTKLDPTVFAVAESMHKKLGEILKMKDTHRHEEENTDAEREKDVVEKNDERQIDESFKEDKLQLNNVEELKEHKVEADVAPDQEKTTPISTWRTTL